MDLHKLRRGLRYIKHNKFDISNIDSKIFQNSYISSYHNRFNINNKNYIMSLLDIETYNVIKKSLRYGMFGGFTLNKKSIFEIVQLKAIIKYRLKNYYNKEVN